MVAILALKKKCKGCGDILHNAPNVGNSSRFCSVCEEIWDKLNIIYIDAMLGRTLPLSEMVKSRKRMKRLFRMQANQPINKLNKQTKHGYEINDK